MRILIKTNFHNVKVPLPWDTSAMTLRSEGQGKEGLK